MGAFEKNSKAGMGLLISNSMPFAYTEAFKTLRTNLSFASVSKKYKKIVITSSVPDEGKSTLQTHAQRAAVWCNAVGAGRGTWLRSINAEKACSDGCGK